jgi:hypothetical protein
MSYSPCPALLCLIGAAACQPPPAASAGAPQTSCPADQAELVQLLSSLPEQPSRVRGRPDLPVASLGGVIREGRAVDIGQQSLSLDGEPLPGATPGQRIDELARRLAAEGSAEASLRPAVYLTLPRDIDARTFRKYLAAIPSRYQALLVFQTPAPANNSSGSALGRFLAEVDPARRGALAEPAYEEHARCGAINAAVGDVEDKSPAERWPALRSALIDAVPTCACSDLDAPELKALIMAEQRGGAAALGALPFDFMRDERCGASLELTPIQKIVQDIEAFDAEFAGTYRADTVEFEQVVENQRLLNYLCQALPGETLASLQRTKHTFFWKVKGKDECQAWQFQPLAPGSPMGTWRRRGEGPPLAVHYWQGAEEIRLYGPAPDELSKPTDERDWQCNQEFVMRGIDAQSIELEKGRWFFNEEACRAAGDRGAFSGCIAELAGAPPAAPGTPKAAPAQAPGGTERPAQGSERPAQGPGRVAR